MEKTSRFYKFIDEINNDEEKKKIIDNEALIRLYINFQQETHGWLNLHRQHFTQFVTIILAFLTAFLGIFYHFQSQSQITCLLKLALASLFSFNVMLSIVGIKVCDRFYQRFLESITIANKLYLLLKNGIGDIDLKIKNNEDIYKNDSHLFPNRWINATKNYEKTDKLNSKNRKEQKGFVEDHMWKGSNRYIRITFIILGIINTIAVVALIFYPK